jgi:5-methylcytosine-specific restriction protein B
MIDPIIASELREILDRLLAEGNALSESTFSEQMGNFRERFSPEVFAGLDGEQLLKHMHGSIDENALNYWLEFKNDDEFSSPKYGSIAGGSALKFGIYRRKEDGAWYTGIPRKQERLDLDKAIEIARQQRDQLVEGAELIKALPQNASDIDYLNLQKELDEKAGKFADSGWGHKYFHILYPDKIDDFHAPYYQIFHLIKLLPVSVIAFGQRHPWASLG